MLELARGTRRRERRPVRTLASRLAKSSRLAYGTFIALIDAACLPALYHYEHMFYTRRVRAEYRLEPCKSALNPVRGMPFRWSLNPYMGCVHRCTFCYVRHFEQRADRPADDRYGRSIRVKTNVADVLRRELARPSWERDEVALGTATDPYQPAEGRFRLTRACLLELADSGTPFSIVTRGPLVVRDIDVLQEASAQVEVERVLLGPDARRARLDRRPSPAPRRRAAGSRPSAGCPEAGIDVGVGMAPILPGLSDRPEQLDEVVRAARDAGARGIWASVVHLRPGVREHFLEALAQDWPEEVARYEALFARARVPARRAHTPHDRARARGLSLDPVAAPPQGPSRLEAAAAEQLSLAV